MSANLRCPDCRNVVPRVSIEQQSIAGYGEFGLCPICAVGSLLQAWQEVEFTGRMRSVCMTCGIAYASKPCPPEQDGAVSHGYCPTHLPYPLFPNSNETQNASSCSRSA